MNFCTECVSSFFSGSNLGVVSLSWGVSALFLILLRYKRNLPVKRKLVWMYAHLFSLLFPFLFFLFYQGCEQFLSGCRGFAKAVLLFMLTGLVSFVGVSLISPFLFIKEYMRSSRRFPGTLLAVFAYAMAKTLSLQVPRVFFVDSERPFAFSLHYRKPCIFFSIGLCGLLSRREGEAVVLHELHHLKSMTSIYKWSAGVLHFFSPISRVACFYKDLNAEERRADRFAMKVQNTPKHLRSAKRKVWAFYKAQH